MKFDRLFATAAAAALLTATTAATAAPVVSHAAPRAATPTAGESRLGAEVPRTTLFSIGILAALIVIVLVATKGDGNNGNNNPTSP